MIVRAVKKLLRRRPKPRYIDASVHGIRPHDIDSDAADAVAKLRRAGHESYIVGGAVRDLLLNITPKDFDVSTAATPGEVRRLFRRARIIGRRFKIVHLTAYRDGVRRLIEITTFRGDGGNVVSDAGGRILQDNTFGDASEDAVRRDFTCNALFYNPEDRRIMDYIGGYEDILSKRLRIIGDPDSRFCEDPVRILRALRLHSKLGMTLGRPLHAAICQHAPLLADISPSRLFDEVVKVANSGYAAPVFADYVRFGIAPHILPVLALAGDFAFAVLESTDRRQSEGSPISLSFMLAGLFWPKVEKEWLFQRREKKQPPVRAMEIALDTADFNDNPIIPRRVVGRIIDLYFLQARMEARISFRRAAALTRHPLFNRAVAFAELRQNGGAKWWDEYKRADTEERKRMVEKARAA